jgi:hypothetical protein
MHRFQSIWEVTTFTGVMPTHKLTGKINHCSILSNDHKYEPLKRHFEYLSNLGEVQATQVITRLVDGMLGCANHNNDQRNQRVTCLPISMGYRSCYKRYMALLGYIVRSLATGAFIVEEEDGKAVNHDENVSYSTYCNKWKSDYPNLKVSWPIKDICPYCYACANRNRHLVQRGGGCGNDGDNKGKGNSNGLGQGKGKMYIGNADGNGNKEVANIAIRRITRVDLNPPKLASTNEEEERELMLLEAAAHIKMARAQRALYQAKVALAVEDATVNKDHLVRVY